jgi:fluoroacetyl-CoA thioesterase
MRMRTIPIGAQGSFTLEVPESLASQFENAMLPDVLATPVLVMVIGNAALAALEPYLKAGEIAVGTRVDIRHLAPTLVGMRVIGEASVTRVEGRQIQFSVSAAMTADRSAPEVMSAWSSMPSEWNGWSRPSAWLSEAPAGPRISGAAGIE